MESIFALSPISSRVRRSSFASISALTTQNHNHTASATNAARVGNSLHFAKLSPLVNLPSEMAKRVSTLFPAVSCLLIKEFTDSSRLVSSRSDFRMHHSYSISVVEAVWLENRARFAKGPPQLSTHDLNEKKTVSTFRTEQPLLRPLHDRAESGTWAQQAVNTAIRNARSAVHDISDSKTADKDDDDDFEGYDYEIDRNGFVVLRFLKPPNPSRHDIYNRRRFNEDLIFQFDAIF